MNSDKKLFEIYRDEFPGTEDHVYLDRAGVAPVSLRGKRAVEKFLSEATESGMFNYKQWMDRVEEVRRSCAILTGAEPEEIAFVKNTSQGISIVAEGLDWKEGDNLLICEKDFPSNIYPWLNLKRKGVEIRVVPSQNERILLEDIELLIDSRTKLLTVSSVNFSSGFKIDLEVVGRLCKGKGILFFVEEFQTWGGIPWAVNDFKKNFFAQAGIKCV